ncbi:MAG: AAA family ATPase [Alloprevotella sp.]|nr:AAA family ATPase [Alloprevotella sp.]
MLSAAAAYEYFAELQQIQNSADLHARYALLRRIFRDILDEAVQDFDTQPIAPYPQLLLLLRNDAIRRDTFEHLNNFRSRSQNTQSQPSETLSRAFPADMGRVVALVCELSGLQPPTDELRALFHAPTIAASELSKVGTASFSAAGRAPHPYLRVIVERWDDTYIYIYNGQNHAGEPRAFRYAQKNFYGEWESLRTLLYPGCQLNLIRPHHTDSGETAELFIFEPDYLLDISAIAACFDTRSPLQHLLGRFFPPLKNNAYVLLGNFVGQLFDEVVHAQEGNPPSAYADSSRAFFRQNALELATATFPFDFHTEAAAQRDNLRKLLRWDGARTKPAFDFRHGVLEPSFFCEMLGIQGRMDYLQEDYTELIELKSGQRAFGRYHQEPHYVQVLLYRALLHYSYGLTNEEIHSYLLYPRYPDDGLMLEGAAPELLGEAIRMRNAMVAEDLALATDGGEGVLGHLTPDALNFNPAHSVRFWAKYKRPAFQRITDRVQQAPPLERSYFYRMLRFIAREQVLSRIGASGREAGGFAALWGSTFEEKLQSGSILAPLRLKIYALSTDGGVEAVELYPPADQPLSASTFREGDAAVLYSYPADGEPDVRHGIVMRGRIARLQADSLQFHLTAAQKNRHLFGDARCYAVEHDSVDTYRPLYRGLFTLLEVDADRRALFLNQRSPECDTSVRLLGDYGPFNELVLAAKRARDYYLIVGPPGTGKTSFGMLNVLREALLTPHRTILLAAFTNRAVDEVCSKLVHNGISFIRLGREVNSSRECWPHLMHNQATSCRNVEEFRELMVRTRVIVATTTMLCATPHLFELKSFDLCIIDEASQIIEPQILPLFTVKHHSKPAIRKFVLIGDHKQLPAVVQQSEAESRVADDTLRAIGLTDCRHSLFERLLPVAEAAGLTYHMNHQGRMHPEVADFANIAFYGGKLQPVPLPHQRESLNFSKVSGTLGRLLAQKRLLFFAVENGDVTPGKTNAAEAKLVAQICATVWRLYTDNGRAFDAERTLGVIVPYRNQISQIRNELQRLAESPDHPLLDISIDTVERYQGSERDVIIYGFTAVRRQQLQFLTSQTFCEGGKAIDRKLNVAMTRAREQLFLVGKPSLLRQNSLLGQLIDYAVSVEGYVDAAELSQEQAL